jgi:hypothetical protein
MRHPGTLSIAMRSWAGSRNRCLVAGILVHIVAARGLSATSPLFHRKHLGDQMASPFEKAS